MHWIVHLDGGPKRVNHAAVAVGHKIYSFGGYCSGENSRDYISMDVHVLNSTTFRWTRHPVSDLPYYENDDILPYKRYGHTAVQYDNKVYIWGGRNDRVSDGVLFCFDTVWHCWTAPKTNGSNPAARDGHTAVVWRNFMILYGGYEDDSDSYADAVYILNLHTMTWNRIQCHGCIEPTTRDFHTAVCINDTMYMFGGKHITNTGDEIYPNGIWSLDLNGMQWHHLENICGNIPVGRRSHSAFAYNGRMYIFGGYNPSKNEHYNDMYEFDPETLLWRLVRANGMAPCERRRQTCVLVHDRLFLFGGTSPHLHVNISHFGNATIEQVDDYALMDHCDLHVLDFRPTLKTLSIMAVLKHRLSVGQLPIALRNEIQNMCLPNKITVSRPNNSAG